MIVMATIEAIGIIEVVEPKVPLRGRPKLTADERKIWEEKKKSTEYLAERKKSANASVKRSYEKALRDEKWKCPLCAKCYKTKASLEYHRNKSMAHK